MMRVFHKCAHTQIADGLVMTQLQDQNPKSLLPYPKSSTLSECLSLSRSLSASLCFHSLDDILKATWLKLNSHFRILVLYLAQEWDYIKLLFSPIILLFSVPSLSNHIPINHWSDDLWPLLIELDRGCVGLLTSLNGDVGSWDYGSQMSNS